MRRLIGLSFLLYGLCAHAEGKRNTIVFEVSSPTGLEQSSYSWDDRTLTYVTNSNFTQASPDRALLGVFRRPLDHSLQRELAGLLDETQETKAKGRPFAHSIRLKINGKSVAPGSPAYAKLLTWAARFSHDSWSSEDGLELRLEATGKVSWKPLSQKLAHGPIRLECTRQSAEQHCRAAPYGHVSLKAAGDR